MLLKNVEKLFPRFFINPNRNVFNHENLTVEERSYRSLAFRLEVYGIGLFLHYLFFITMECKIQF